MSFCVKIKGQIYKSLIFNITIVSSTITVNTISLMTMFSISGGNSILLRNLIGCLCLKLIQPCKKKVNISSLV